MILHDSDDFLSHMELFTLQMLSSLLLFKEKNTMFRGQDRSLSSA